jgi:hypothetical protein
MPHAPNVEVGVQMQAQKIKSQGFLSFGPHPNLEVQLPFLE